MAYLIATRCSDPNYIITTTMATGVIYMEVKLVVKGSMWERLSKLRTNLVVFLEMLFLITTIAIVLYSIYTQLLLI